MDYLWFTLGSSWNFTLTFTDDVGVVENITEDSFTITDAKPAVIANAILTKVDAAAGKLQVYLAAEYTADLRIGGAYSFRVRRTRDADFVENTPIIPVQIR